MQILFERSRTHFCFGGHAIDRDIAQKSGSAPEHRLLDIGLDKDFRDCSFPPAAECTVRDVTLTYAWRLEQAQ